MTVASVQYLIGAYHEVDHLQRLCRTLRRLDPECEILVQFDRSGDHRDLAQLDIAAGLRLTDRPVRWGDHTYLDALLASLAYLMTQPWEWLVLLSGQDYPIRPTNDLRSHLESAGAAGIAVSHEVPNPGGRWRTASDDAKRYWTRYWWIPLGVWALAGGAAGIGRVLRWLARRPLVDRYVCIRGRPRGESGGVGWRRLDAPFSEGRPCRKGSDFFVLRRDAVELLMSNAASLSDLVAHIRHTAIPTECFHHTLLHPELDDSLLEERLHFARWHEPSPHPELLQLDDLPDMTTSSCFFARKFTGESTPLLDRIDAELLGL